MDKSDLPARFQNKKVSIEDAIAWVGGLEAKDAYTAMMVNAVGLLLSSIQPLRDENAKMRNDKVDAQREVNEAKAELRRIDRIIEIAGRY